MSKAPMPKHHTHATARRSLRATAPSAPISEFGRLARQLTEFRKANEILSRAASCEHVPADNCHLLLIERMREELAIRETMLKQHMVWVEPETIEDAAALTVLVSEMVDVIDVQYVDPQFHGQGSEPIDDAEQWHYRCDMPMMKSMLHNLIGCLKRHAKTNATGWESWAEGLEPSFSFSLATALAAAKRLEMSATATTESAANDVAA